MIETRGKLIKGHLHDGVILLLRPESFSLFFSYLNLVILERFKCRNLHRKGKPLRILVAVVNDVIVQMAYQMYFIRTKMKYLIQQSACKLPFFLDVHFRNFPGYIPYLLSQCDEKRLPALLVFL